MVNREGPTFSRAEHRFREAYGPTESRALPAAVPVLSTDDRNSFSALAAGSPIMCKHMLRPDYKEFSRLARGATLVPVVKSVAADLLTPVSAFLAVAANEPNAFLLESVERGEQVGRYTFFGRQAIHAGCGSGNGNHDATRKPPRNAKRKRNPGFERPSPPTSTGGCPRTAAIHRRSSRIFFVRHGSQP